MNNNDMLTKVTVQNYQEAFRRPDNLIRYGNHFYIVNKKYDEIKGMVPQPLPRNTLYKRYEIKC